MKLAIVITTFVASVFLAESVGSRQLGSLDTAQGLYEAVVPPGFCALSGYHPGEAQVLDHQTRYTEKAALKLLTYFIDCEQLTRLRAGVIELDRFGYLVTPMEPGELAAISTERYVELMAQHIAAKQTVDLEEGLARLSKGTQSIEIGVLQQDASAIYEGRLSLQSSPIGQNGNKVMIALNGYTKLGAVPVVITLIVPFENRASLEKLLKEQHQRVLSIAQTN